MTKIRTLLPGLLLLTACGTHSAIEQSRNFARLGDYRNAFQVLDAVRTEEQKDGGSVASDLESAHHQAWLAFLLASARDHIFEEKEELALLDLATLEEQAPDYRGAKALRERALYKKAVRAAQRGDEFLLRKDLMNALTCYIESEKSLPGIKAAADGAENVRKALERLSARAQDQFLEAVRKMPEFRFVEVRWHANNAVTNNPLREDASALRSRAQREIALRAFARGRECEKKDQFGAALVEFKSAQKLDKSLPGVDEAIVQMEREVEASRLLEKAQMDMRTHSFDLAREQLSKAFELSVMARGRISELMIETRRLEGESRYQVGRDLEVLGKKAEALAAYEALSKEWPEGLSDEKARIDGLRIDVDNAQKEWTDAEAAETAGDLAKAVEHYQNAERFYAGWKDGKARIERLLLAIVKAAGGASGGG